MFKWQAIVSIIFEFNIKSNRTEVGHFVGAQLLIYIKGQITTSRHHESYLPYLASIQFVC